MMINGAYIEKKSPDKGKLIGTETIETFVQAVSFIHIQLCTTVNLTSKI